MTIQVNLIGDTLPVEVCDETGQIGGGFYYQPHLQPYSPVPLKWVWEQLSRYPHAVLLDVGASSGVFSLLAKHHPSLTVYAFEPVPLAARVLRENVYLNGLMDKVTVSECAVSNYCGTGIMHVVKDVGGLGVSMFGGTPAWHKDCEHIETRVVTIDKWCLHGSDDIAPTLLKIDVEGGEKLVLEGARETIEKYHPMLLFETSNENTSQYGYNTHELIKMIEEWNYIWLSPEGLDCMCIWKDWDKQ